jgi:hypothetical protein
MPRLLLKGRILAKGGITMYKSNFKSIFWGLISILFLLGVFATSTIALEGVAGEVIKTVEELKELEAKGLLSRGEVLSYTELIRDFGVTIPIVKKTDRRLQFTASKTYVEFTEKNKGKAKIGPGDELINYGGQGQPFPDVKPDDPQAGIKAAHNWDLRHTGDSAVMSAWDYLLTDSKGNVKNLGGLSNSIRFTRRTDRDPKPFLTGAPGEVWFKYLIQFSKPFASKGLGQVQIKYEDAKRESDLYVYVPGLRRNVRVGGGNRCDCLGGFVFNMDDSDLWSGDTTKFKWKLLEVREKLTNSWHSWEETKAGKDIIPKAHWTKPILERRKVWIIEQTPKDSAYCYSKRIYHQDPENWIFTFMEMYDRLGSLWKTENQNHSIFPNPEEAGGGYLSNNVSGDTLDHKIFEGGPYYHHDIQVNPNISADMFTLDALRRAGR